jgi:hypothetical protein
MAKETKKVKEVKIPLEKMITPQEMEALIAVARSRQEFFQKMSNERRTARERSEALLKERFNGLASKELQDKMQMLAEKLMAKADEVYLAQFKTELAHQSGMVEFLHRFTNEKFEDYSLEFKV